MSNQERCLDCGTYAGDIHHPRCKYRTQGRPSREEYEKLMIHKAHHEGLGRRFQREHSPDWQRDELRIKDEGSLTFKDPPQPANMVFMDDNGAKLGEFLYDKDARRWTFEGDMDKSAQQFAKFMFANFQSIIEGDRDNLLKEPVYIAVDPATEKDESFTWPANVPMPGILGG